MDLDTFKQQLHTLFENCDYSNMLKEDSEQKVKFVHNCTDGTVYEIEVEPEENEFYVFQDGKQIDLFNLNLIDQDGGISKDKRQMIVNDWEENHKSKSSSEPAKPVEPAQETSVAESVAIDESEIGDEFHGKIVSDIRNPERIGKVASFGNLRHTKGSNTVSVWWKGETNPELDVDKRRLKIVDQTSLTKEDEDIIKKFEDQYGKERGKSVYYATANKQDRDPETFKKI